ncbi:hypothetical protein F5Y15DRAFT_371045 [Xylariaceae sp. FL0016]|nr:hypothetical protein F5Y15DRAFT_371045 [Xylariaceae sp. FL0016]
MPLYTCPKLFSEWFPSQMPLLSSLLFWLTSPMQMQPLRQIQRQISMTNRHPSHNLMFVQLSSLLFPSRINVHPIHAIVRLRLGRDHEPLAVIFSLRVHLRFRFDDKPFIRICTFFLVFYFSPTTFTRSWILFRVWDHSIGTDSVEGTVHLRRL